MMVKTKLATWVFVNVLLIIWPNHAVQANVDHATPACRVEHEDLRLYAFLMRSIAICSPS
jgi:hypothetical protein